MKPWYKSKTVWVGILEILAGIGDVLVSWLNGQTDVPPLVGYTLLVSGLAKVLLRTLTKEPIKVPKPPAKLLTFWLGAALLMIMPAVSSGQVWFESNCPGGICPTGYQTRQVVRQTPIRTVAKTVTRPVSYGSTGTTYGYSYGSTGASYGYSYGSSGSRAGFWGRGPLRRLLTAPVRALRSIRANRQVQAELFAPAVIYAPDTLLAVSDSVAVETLDCVGPTRRAADDCVKPTRQVAADCVQPTRQYTAKWIIRDGKTVDRHLKDGFPGRHAPVPKEVIDDLSIDNQQRLHDYLHDHG